MAKAIHSMIRVLDEARSVDFYARAFGLRVADRLDFKGRTEPYDRGDGYGHLAVLVEDLAAEHARFEAEDLNPRKMVEFAPDGELVGKFFFVADPDGYEIEVLERGGRFK